VVGLGDNIAELIFSAAARSSITFRNLDIVVISHTIVSRAEGRQLNLNTIEPSTKAVEIAEKTGKDPRHVEVILRESRRVLRVERGVIISETKHGITSANAGVDASNSGGPDYVITLPEDPDLSAARIRYDLKRLTGRELAVIICDTVGRPFRRGTVNIAIGCSGINPLWDRRGEKDLFGRILTSKITCVADEIASAAELVIGQADEGTPVAIVRGYDFEAAEIPARTIIRPDEENLFR
jgi:coenzyme F420-0:L-glutamate ligase/coenzyme F420-1:gamma-L-glutamate ligase